MSSRLLLNSLCASVALLRGVFQIKKIVFCKVFLYKWKDITPKPLEKEERGIGIPYLKVS